jgi:hypothetical protein
MSVSPDICPTRQPYETNTSSPDEATSPRPVARLLPARPRTESEIPVACGSLDMERRERRATG